ncbi:MAG: pilus assembly protein PilP [Burkholderiales bacterium]
MILSLALTGCGSEEFSDIKDFIKESEKGLKGRVEPLPEVKPYEPFTYNAFDLPDPFKPRKIQAAQGAGGGGKLQPDLNRRKEALEAFPLENLKMVGTLQQKNVMHALIKTPDNNLYRIKTGNYAGQNFGLVTGVTEATVNLKELIQDSAGDWTERESTLQLLDEQERKK